MTAVLLLLALCAAEAIGPPNGGQDSGLQVTRENPTKADISPRSASFLEEEETLCSGAQCGLCNQPCAQTCCGPDNGGTPKPECCSQHENVTTKIVYVPPRQMSETKCPQCNLCPTIMAQSYVDPDVANCCNAHPCGIVKSISNDMPNWPRNVTVQLKNPYGAHWTYRKHIQKHGIDTTRFMNDSRQIKAAVALAAKASGDHVQEMTEKEDPGIPLNTSNTSSAFNTSSVPGVAVVVMPEGVNIDDWHIAHPNGKWHPNMSAYADLMTPPNTSNSTNSSDEYTHERSRDEYMHRLDDARDSEDVMVQTLDITSLF